MTNIIIDPMCLLGISTYHQKNLPTGFGASIGILYALQKQLTYKISMSSPLGTHKQTTQQICHRLVEFQYLRNKKAKDNINYYDQFILVGWYFMGSEKYYNLQKQKIKKISQAFTQRGAPYFLQISQEGTPTLFKNNQKIKYSASMDSLQKYCSDTMYFQSSKSQSAIVKTLKKQEHLLQIYNQKLKKLSKLLKDGSNQTKRQVLQILDMYERIQYFNEEKKSKVIEAINYSVLSGLILSHQKVK